MKKSSSLGQHEDLVNEGSIQNEEFLAGLEDNTEIGLTRGKQLSFSIKTKLGSQDDIVLDSPNKERSATRAKDDHTIDYSDKTSSMFNDFQYDQDQLNRDPVDIEETPDLVE